MDSNQDQRPASGRVVILPLALGDCHVGGIVSEPRTVFGLLTTTGVARPGM